MFKRKLILPILIGLGILFFILALKSEPVKTKSFNTQVRPITQADNKIDDSTKEQTTNNFVKSKSSPSPAVTSTPKPTLSPIPTTQPSPTNNYIVTPSSASAPSPYVNQVNVSITKDDSLLINGGSNFSIELSDGANQCDVLTKALQEGKINSLNMQYSDTYKTYAIYQINGIGKEGQVWWTYSVNGKNPPLGCSLVKVNNNDNIVWTYIGPS